jgi:hypothetical protein
MYNGMGGYKYGLKGAQPGWCVVSSVGRVVVYCEAKKKKKEKGDHVDV